MNTGSQSELWESSGYCYTSAMVSVGVSRGIRVQGRGLCLALLRVTIAEDFL
jgi:hypothetical protein